MERNRITCFLCGNEGKLAYPEKVDLKQISEFTFSSRKVPELMHFEYLECGECGLRFSSYVPDSAELVAEYAKAGFDSDLEASYASRTYAALLQRYLPAASGRLLDVGSGDGTFLHEALRLGCSAVVGIEPSAAPAAKAKVRPELSIHQGPWETFESKEQFSIVTLFQTIEHLTDPLKFMRFAHDILEEEGVLAIAAHDFSSLINRILRRRSPIFDIEHLQLFSARSLGALFRAAGFEVVSNEAYVNRYPLRYFVRLAPLPASMKRARFLNETWLARQPIRAPFGNRMVIGRKISS